MPRLARKLLGLVLAAALPVVTMASDSVYGVAAGSVFATSNVNTNYQNVGYSAAGGQGANGQYTTYVINTNPTAPYLSWYGGQYLGQVMYIVNTKAYALTSYFNVPVSYQGSSYSANGGNAVTFPPANAFITCVWDGTTWRTG